MPALAAEALAHGAERLLVRLALGFIVGGGLRVPGGCLPAPGGLDLRHAGNAVLVLGGVVGVRRAPRLLAARAAELAERLVLRDPRRRTPLAFALEGGEGRLGGALVPAPVLRGAPVLSLPRFLLAQGGCTTNIKLLHLGLSPPVREHRELGGGMAEVHVPSGSGSSRR